MGLTEAQLQELYDKQKLHENLMLYCRGIDRYDIPLIKSTYWDDSWDDHGSFVGPGVDWAAAGLTWRELLYNNNHHVTNVLIELEGDRARRESMFMCVTNRKDPRVSVFLGGRYRDLCERRDNEWRVLHRVCIWDWVESYPTTGGWEMVGVPPNSNWGQFHPNDPINQDWSKSSPTNFPRPADLFAYSNSKHDNGIDHRVQKDK